MSTYLAIEDVYAKIIAFVAEAPAEDFDEDCLDEEGNEPQFEVMRLEIATYEEARACVRHLTGWAEAKDVPIVVTSNMNYVYIQR